MTKTIKFLKLISADRDIRSRIVRLYENSLSDHRYHIFLFQNGIDQPQLFEVKVGVVGLNVWKKLLSNYPLIFPPDTEYQLILEKFGFI